MNVTMRIKRSDFRRVVEMYQQLRRAEERMTAEYGAPHPGTVRASSVQDAESLGRIINAIREGDDEV